MERLICLPKISKFISLKMSKISLFRAFCRKSHFFNCQKCRIPHVFAMLCFIILGYIIDIAVSSDGIEVAVDTLCHAILCVSK